MKKHKIYPISTLRIVWLSIWLFISIISLGAIIFVFIEDQYTVIHCFGLICGAIGLFVSIVIFCLDLKKGITFKDDGLSVMADPADAKGLLVRRLQHKTEINYNEIEDIVLVASDKDSLGKTVKNVFVNMPYIVFKCKNGKQKAINVYYYNKKQKIKIIDEVKRRAIEVGEKLEIKSGEELWNKYWQENK